MAGPSYVVAGKKQNHVRFLWLIHEGNSQFHEEFIRVERKSGEVKYLYESIVNLTQKSESVLKYLYSITEHTISAYSRVLFWVEYIWPKVSVQSVEEKLEVLEE